MLRLNSSTLKQSTTTAGVAGCEREQKAQNTCVVDYISKWQEGEANSEQGGGCYREKAPPLDLFMAFSTFLI